MGLSSVPVCKHGDLVNREILSRSIALHASKARIK
jgi:hypothetical protein